MRATHEPDYELRHLIHPGIHDVSAAVPAGIRISPFMYRDLDREHRGTGNSAGWAQRSLESRYGREPVYTFSGRHALSLVLDDLALKSSDVVTILTTYGTGYVSHCVTDAIEKTCRWSMKHTRETRAILVIHEWGMPRRDIPALRRFGVPIIEDCAYAFASSIGGVPVGMQGDFAIFSFPKIFPIDFGGMALGLRRAARAIPASTERYLLSTIAPELRSLRTISRKRIANWRHLERIFEKISITPHFRLEPGAVPGVFMFKLPPGIVPEKVKAAFQARSIEASVYYGARSIFIPCHQRMGLGAMSYLRATYMDSLIGGQR